MGTDEHLLRHRTLGFAGGRTTQAAILAQITTSLEAQGLDVDEECLKDIIAKLDSATIAAQDGAALQEIGQEAAGCATQP